MSCRVLFAFEITISREKSASKPRMLFQNSLNSKYGIRSLCGGSVTTSWTDSSGRVSKSKRQSPQASIASALSQTTSETEEVKRLLFRASLSDMALRSALVLFSKQFHTLTSKCSLGRQYPITQLPTSVFSELAPLVLPRPVTANTICDICPDAAVKQSFNAGRTDSGTTFYCLEQQINVALCSPREHIVQSHFRRSVNPTVRKETRLADQLAVILGKGITERFIVCGGHHLPASSGRATSDDPDLLHLVAIPEIVSCNCRSVLKQVAIENFRSGLLAQDGRLRSAVLFRAVGEATGESVRRLPG